VEASANVSGLAVFGYGSLASRESAAQTLGRSVSAPRPARLRGWSRAWTLVRDNLASEKTFARADGSLPRFCLGLNLEPSRQPTEPNGALIAVSMQELERLDLREMRYLRADVRGQIEHGEASQTVDFDHIYAYVARPEHHHATTPPDTILIASYLRAVESAFDALGPGELERFRATTLAPAAEVVEARLVDGERIPRGNPRDW
jgi:hypothetical protein